MCDRWPYTQLTLLRVKDAALSLLFQFAAALDRGLLERVKVNTKHVVVVE